MIGFAALRKETFGSLANPNYRCYFIGQAISLTGTWMQIVAQSWLMLQLSGSGAALGAVTVVQTLPMLVLGPYGGVIADRFDKRKLLRRGPRVPQGRSAKASRMCGALRHWRCRC